VPEDDGWDGYEDDKAGNDVAEELAAQDGGVLHVVIRFRLTLFKFWQLEKTQIMI